MGDALLIVLGSAISIVATVVTDWVRERRSNTRSERTKRREVVDIYLPQALDLLVAANWQIDDLQRRQEDVQWENPYPKPDGDFPGHWYPHMVRLAYHPLMPEDVRSLARAITSSTETWRAIVQDLDVANDVATDIAKSAEKLVSALEDACS